MKKLYEHNRLPKETLGYAKIIFDTENEKKLSILDLGSANALFAQLYGPHIKTYHAFDINRDAVFSGKYFLKNNCDFDWTIKYCNLKEYDKFLKKFKSILLKKYDIIVFNRVFHHLYYKRVNKKWKRGKYRSFDILINSFKKAKKWYVFSTTCCHMRKFSLIEFFESNNFKLIFKNDVICRKDPLSRNAWSGVFEKQ